MVNKLAFSQGTVHPIVDEYINRKRYSEKGLGAEGNKEIDEEIPKIQEEQRLLTKLRNGAALQPSLYEDQMAKLSWRVKILKDEKKRAEENAELTAARDLRRDLNKHLEEPLTVFPEELFRRHVRRVIVRSHESVRFELYCGLGFTEFF